MDASEVRPLIAVSTSEVRPAGKISPTPQGEPANHEMALGLKYLKALEGAGAIPVVVPPLSPHLVEPLLDRFDGICLSGGPDLDPVAYGERRHTSTGPVWSVRSRSSGRCQRRPSSPSGSARAASHGCVTS